MKQPYRFDDAGENVTVFILDQWYTLQTILYILKIGR